MKRWIKYLIYWPAILKLEKLAKEAQRDIINLRIMEHTQISDKLIEEIHSRVSHLCEEFLTAKKAINFLLD